MTRPLSLDLRQRVIDAINGGLSCRAAAARFGIAPSAAVKWRRLWRETGSVAPRRQGGERLLGRLGQTGRIEAVGGAILGMVEATPDLTLAEIAGRLEREHGARFAASTVHRFFRRRGWSFKKSPAMRANRSARTSVPRARRGSRRSPVSIPSG